MYGGTRLVSQKVSRVSTGARCLDAIKFNQLVEPPLDGAALSLSCSNSRQITDRQPVWAIPKQGLDLH